MPLTRFTLVLAWGPSEEGGKRRFIPEAQHLQQDLQFGRAQSSGPLSSYPIERNDKAACVAGRKGGVLGWGVAELREMGTNGL